MGTIKFKGIEAYEKQLKELGDVKFVEDMCKYAIYPAADMAAQEIKNAVPVDTGDLRDSLVITPMKTDASGFTSTTVTFAGYDRKGVPNPLKARVLESGRSGPNGNTAKHPFMRRAKSLIEKKAQGLMQTAIDEFIYKKTRK